MVLAPRVEEDLPRGRGGGEEAIGVGGHVPGAEGQEGCWENGGGVERLEVEGWTDG
jgi:hypothetical protein